MPRKTKKNDLIRHGQPPDTTRVPQVLRPIQELSMGAKMRRRAFVLAYVRSFDVGAAYYATGYQGAPKHARIKGNTWLQEPYVQALLARILAEMDEEEIVSRKEVLAGLKKEANYMGEGTTHSARVSAWSKLGAAVGMGTEKASDNRTLVQTTGNVMVVPIAQSADEWENAARTQQARLKAEVKQIGRDHAPEE